MNSPSSSAWKFQSKNEWEKFASSFFSVIVSLVLIVESKANRKAAIVIQKVVEQLITVQRVKRKAENSKVNESWNLFLYKIPVETVNCNGTASLLCIKTILKDVEKNSGENLIFLGFATRFTIFWSLNNKLVKVEKFFLFLLNRFMRIYKLF